MDVTLSGIVIAVIFVLAKTLFSIVVNDSGRVTEIRPEPEKVPFGRIVILALIVTEVRSVAF